MFDTYQEHLEHSAPCASRYDGFDRGDRCDSNEYQEWLDAQNEEWEEQA